MNRSPVASSTIKSIGFDGSAMHIEFANGNVYEYTGPKVKTHYDALLAAPSIGKHFGAHVRTCTDTTCRRVGG